MSLNNVRQYALMLMLLCGAAGLSGMAQPMTAPVK